MCSGSQPNNKYLVRVKREEVVDVMKPPYVPRKRANKPQVSRPVKVSAHTRVSQTRLLTTRWARDRERRWRDGSHGSLEHTDETRRGGGRTAGREYVFCCSPACRINSWHEHNVSPLWFLARCAENNGIHRVPPHLFLRQRSAPTCHKHPVIWPHPSAWGFVM